MVRLTNDYMSSRILDNIQSNMSKVYELQDQLSTGKKFTKPSDNPIDSNRKMRVTESLRREEQYLENVDNMVPVLNLSASVMSSITEKVREAKNLSLQFQNSAIDSNTQQMLSTSMGEILETVVNLANTKQGNRFILGGYHNTETPYVVENGRIRYRGTDDVLTAEIGQDESVDVSVPGNDFFVTHAVTGSTVYGAKDSVVKNPDTNIFHITVGSEPPITVGFGVTTQLANTNSGNGITGTSFNIDATTITVSGTTIQDALDSINNQSGVTDVKARINDARNGVELYSTTASAFAVTENGSSTASDLGILGNSDGNDEIQGSTLNVLNVFNTLEDVRDAINTSGAEVRAYIKETSVGYKLKIMSNFVGTDGQVTLSDDVSGGILNKLGLIDTSNAISGSQTDYNRGTIDSILRLTNDLQGGDLVGARQESAKLDLGMENLINKQALIGSMTQSVETRRNVMLDLRIGRQELLSNIEDIDYAEVIQELSKQMMAYESAIKVGAQIIKPSLLDYM
jgi:flagellar hook-associated protein 3 FlgL